MTLIEIKLQVPSASAGCAEWICKQAPEVAAEALSLSELSFNALRREISDSETSRILAAHHDQVQDLQQQLQHEREKTRQVSDKLRASAEEMLAADRVRHNAAIEALQRQLQTVSEAHRATQKLMADEQQTHAAAMATEIADLKARLLSEKSDASRRLAEEVKALRSEHSEQLQRSQESAAEAQKVLRDQYQSRVACSEEESKRINDGLQADLRTLTQKLVDAQSAQQDRLDQAKKSLRDKLEEDHAREVDLLRVEISSLAAELKKKEGSEALAREETRRASDEYIRAQAVSLAEVREQLRTVLEEKARELEQRDQDHQRLLREREDWLKGELTKRDELLVRRDEALQAATEAQKQSTLEYSARVEALTTKHQELLKNLCGTSSSVGRVGESLVSTVFARMNLGTWQDDSKNPAEGFADALWTWTPPNCAPLAALIDVKLVSQIHSKHDVEKFYTDLRTAIACNRANAGMLISLNARCPNTRPLDISIFHGAPVCIVSRAANDDLSATSMVEMGFLALAQAWPLICRQKSGGDEQTVVAAAQHLDSQLQELEKFMKKIMAISGQATRLARTAEDLRKMAVDMVKGIEVLRQSHPQLSPIMDEPTAEEEPESSEDDADWESEGARDLLRAFHAFLDAQAGNAKAHYPKSLTQLAEISESAEAFVKSTANAFQTATNKVKEQRRIAGASKRRKVAE